MFRRVALIHISACEAIENVDPSFSPAVAVDDSDVSILRAFEPGILFIHLRCMLHYKLAHQALHEQSHMVLQTLQSSRCDLLVLFSKIFTLCNIHLTSIFGGDHN